MTKKEFNDYIKSFGKKQGKFTDEEIYQIGIAHKKLDLTERNWNNLVKTLGLAKTGEQLRSWIKHRQYNDNSLPKNTKLLSNRTINDLEYDEFSKEVENQKRELYKQQVKTRDTWNAYRRSIRSEARIEELREFITETIESLDKLPKFNFDHKLNKNNKTEAILMLSDLHIGVDCNNFYNTYNIDVATKRLNKLVDDTIRYCKSNNVETLNILNLGDLIQGIIHTNARIEVEVDVISQVMTASELLSKALTKLQLAAPKITYRSVVDNHSRITPNKEESIEQENLNRLIDWYIEARLKDSNIIFAHDNIDIGLGKFTLNNGKNVVFSHGHQDKVNNLFQNMVGATREFIDYILIGHMHNTKLKSFNGSKVFINGSICGTEEYALSKRLFSEAEQTLLVFDDVNVIDYTINLQGV